MLAKVTIVKLNNLVTLQLFFVKLALFKLIVLVSHIRYKILYKKAKFTKKV